MSDPSDDDGGVGDDDSDSDFRIVKARDDSSDSSEPASSDPSSLRSLAPIPPRSDPPEQTSAPRGGGEGIGLAETTACEVCGEGDDAPRLILCDGCDAGYHTYCLRPKLSRVPRGEWRCEDCARVKANSATAARTRTGVATTTTSGGGPEEPPAADNEEAGAEAGKDDTVGGEEEAADGDDKKAPARRANPRRSAAARRSYDLNAGYEGAWMCASCSFSNRGTRRRCEMCAAPRQTEETEPRRRPRHAAATRADDFTHAAGGGGDGEDDDGAAYDEILCAACSLGDDPSNLLLCDGCEVGYHVYCLRPKLPCVPRGEWWCPSCMEKEERREAATLEQRRKHAELDLAAADLFGHKKVHLVLASRSASGGDAVPPVVSRGDDECDKASPSQKASPSRARRDAAVQFLVKFEGESYRRARWVPLWAIRHREPGKLRGYWSRTGASELSPDVPPDAAVREHVVPERCVDEREDRDAALVKWCGLGYDECTWEPRGSFLADWTPERRMALQRRKTVQQTKTVRQEAIDDGLGVSSEEEDEEEEGEKEGEDNDAAASGGDALSPIASEDERADSAEKEGFEFGEVDAGRVNHGIAALLTAELRAYRARVARGAPLTTPTRDFGGDGVRFADFERGARSGAGGKPPPRTREPLRRRRWRRALRARRPPP